MALSFGTLVSVGAHKFRLTATSSGHAEVEALESGASQLAFLKRVLYVLEPGLRRPAPLTIARQRFQDSVIIASDSSAAIAFIRLSKTTKKNKHYGRRLHTLRDLFVLGVFQLVFVPTKEQLADICTKALPRVSFEYLRGLLGIAPPE